MAPENVTGPSNTTSQSLVMKKIVKEIEHLSKSHLAIQEVNIWTIYIVLNLEFFLVKPFTKFNPLCVTWHL